MAAGLYLMRLRNWLRRGTCVVLSSVAMGGFGGHSPQT